MHTTDNPVRGLFVLSLPRLAGGQSYTWCPRCSSYYCTGRCVKN